MWKESYKNPRIKPDKQEFGTFQTDSVKSKPIRQSDESTVFKHPEQTTELNLPSANARYKNIGV